MISTGVTSFAADILKIIYQKTGPEENILISPYNIYEALSLLHLGASGSTRNNLADILGLSKNDEQ